jgi:formylglycine-generating enzyme required for sulfatase activity
LNALRPAGKIPADQVPILLRLVYWSDSSIGACERWSKSSHLNCGQRQFAPAQRDATAYAAWYSEATGESWRLPTDEEWAFAAGERFTADVEPLEEDPKNPAKGWLSSYRREVDMARKPNPQPRVRGSFGTNAKGVADMAGNVWEWTSTCYVRVTLAPEGEAVESTVDNCGVHVVEGFHRTYMSNFIRDGKSGGCAVGLPPDNLGFRLVREREGAVARLLSRLRRSI